MRRHYWWYVLVLVLVLLLAAIGMWAQAQAQTPPLQPGGYDCDITLSPDGTVSGHCDLTEPEVTRTASATAPPTVVILPTWTATASPAPATSTATARPTNTPAATATSTITPSPSMAAATATPASTASASPTPSTQPSSTATATPRTATGSTWYISPNGSDTADGRTTTTPWRTFARAWQTVRAGDTLLVMDGTYNQSIAPSLNGTATAPITIRAVNDGKVTIDGQGVRRPVQLGSNNQAVGDWFVIEGLVLRNGTDAVLHVRADNNVFRRVSVYDASTDANSQPLLLWGSNNTVEDCIVGGAGRFMVDVYGGGGVTASGNTVRRCFVKWSGWDGRNFCGVTWPNGFMMGAYNSSGGTFENNVIYGKGVMGLIVQANTSTASASNNHVLGNLTLLQGKDSDGSVWHYGSPTWPTMTRPGPTDDPYDDTNCDDSVTSWSWAGQRVGLKFFGQGTLANNVFRDNLSADNAALGFHYANPGGGRYSGNVLDHLTIYGNGADAPAADGGKGAQAVFPPGVACTNCRVGSATTGDGSGARLTYRYVNRTLTDQPLLPWPMESRALAELGVSVDGIIEEYTER